MINRARVNRKLNNRRINNKVEKDVTMSAGNITMRGDINNMNVNNMNVKIVKVVMEIEDNNTSVRIVRPNSYLKVRTRRVQ